MDDRLPAHIWVSAYIRRMNQAGRPAMLVQRGEKMGGSILIRVDHLNGNAVVLSPSFGLDGERIWLQATGPTAVSWEETQIYIDKRRKFDPDIWIIDVEAGDEDPLLDEPISK